MKDKKLIVLDTSIIIVLIGGKAGSNISNPKERAEQIFDDHKEDLIAITTPGLSECIKIIPDDRITILPMGIEAAYYANLIRNNGLNHKKKKQIINDRVLITADSMILGTALAHKASILYTLDDFFEKAVRELRLPIEIRGLPELKPKQKVLI